MSAIERLIVLDFVICRRVSSLILILSDLLRENSKSNTLPRNTNTREKIMVVSVSL